MHTVLMIEDNPHVMIINRKALKNKYYIIEASTLDMGRKLLKEKGPDIVLLDIMLPDGNGLDFLEEVRKTTDIPILLLTALGENHEIVAGLKRGGDDYITKPYDFSVLLARMEALLRRNKRMIDDQKLKIGSLSISNFSNVARLNDKILPLTVHELSLLKILIQNQGEYIPSKELYHLIWGVDCYNSKSIKQYVYMIRKKIADDSSIIIESIHGKGYRIIQKS